MKNIHLIPTSQPSRLWINNLLQGKLELSKESLPFNTSQNICITNNEEIKEGDYVCASGGFRFVKTLNNDKARTFEDDGIVSKQNPSSSCHLSNYKRIILTTDQDLIKDGVQAIDNEFLEWFVNNPSCEEVEVTYDVLKPFQSKNKGYLIHCPDNEVLEEPKQETTLKELLLQLRNTPMTFVPKEEQKQHLIDMMRYDEELGLYEEPKQYTFKEVKPKDIQRIIASTNAQTASIEILQLFSQYQAKRMYSEEDMRLAIKKARDISDGKDCFDAEDISGCTEICTYDWKFNMEEDSIIEQFKKK